MNQIQIVGNLGQDPETKYSAAGLAITKFSVATKDGRGDKEETNWHRVVVFGKTAEAASKYLNKGDRVGIVGRIKYGKYENRDGQTVYTADIMADKLEFLTSKKERDGGQQSGHQPTGGEQQAQGGQAQYDDDIPF